MPAASAGRIVSSSVPALSRRPTHCACRRRSLRATASGMPGDPLLVASWRETEWITHRREFASRVHGCAATGEVRDPCGLSSGADRTGDDRDGHAEEDPVLLRAELGERAPAVALEHES